MNAIVAEWINKAEGDWVVAGRELRARKFPNYDAVCFHAQQCAEKYLKARLRKNGINPPKTHDLLVLLDSASKFEPGWEIYRPDLAMLTIYSVKFRYPGDSATHDEARECMLALKRFRNEARAAFRLPNE